MDDRTADTASGADGSHWTVQQFTTVAGKPWFALQKHNDSGVVWQATGYRHEIESLCKLRNIQPEKLDPIDEEEFYRRFQTTGPEDFRASFPAPQP